MQLSRSKIGPKDKIANQTTECQIHSREKDVGSATATWFAELLSPAPWFKDVVPNVSINVAAASMTRLMRCDEYG